MAGYEPVEFTREENEQIDKLYYMFEGIVEGMDERKKLAFLNWVFARMGLVVGVMSDLNHPGWERLPTEEERREARRERRVNPQPPKPKFRGGGTSTAKGGKPPAGG